MCLVVKEWGGYRIKFTYIQRITAKLKLVFISPLVLLLCKLLLYFILVTYNFEQVICFSEIVFLKLFELISCSFWMNIVTYEWTYKFYLQADLIISSFLSDIGVPCGVRSSHQKFSIKKLFLKILHNSQENTCVGIFF